MHEPSRQRSGSDNPEQSLFCVHPPVVELVEDVDVVDVDEVVVEEPPEDEEELLELVWQIKNDESHAFVLCTQQLTVPLLHIGISGDKLHATVPPVHSGFPEVHANPPELLELEELDEEELEDEVVEDPLEDELLEEETSPEDEDDEEEISPDDELLDEEDVVEDPDDELLDEEDEEELEEELKQIILELKLPSEL